MQQQSMDGALNAEAVWDAFRHVVATSEHAALPELCARFHAAPANDRLALAGAIASLLAPVEWPASWREPRQRLVRALDDLVLVTAPDSISFDLTLDERDLYFAGWTDLTLARDLLRIPCRRDELRAVAKLCDMGNFARWRAFGRALARAGERSLENPVATTRRRFAVAFGVYAEAARAMNDACGLVLFSGLDFTYRPASRGQAR
jgi:hypothetical protein